MLDTEQRRQLPPKRRPATFPLRQVAEASVPAVENAGLELHSVAQMCALVVLTAQLDLG
jgi:hypothetical protein